MTEFCATFKSVVTSRSLNKMVKSRERNCFRAVAKLVPDGMNVTGVEARAMWGCRPNVDTSKDQMSKDHITGRSFTGRIIKISGPMLTAC